MADKDVMTEEQIRACREYLEIVELMRDWWKTEKCCSPYPYNELRIKRHFHLLEIYGFEYESDTIKVTDDIPEGMTPKELHDKLMELKRKREDERAQTA